MAMRRFVAEWWRGCVGARIRARRDLALGTRTVLLYLLPAVLDSATGGCLVGKLLADVVFYTVAILSYEQHRKLIVPVRLHSRGES